MKHLMTLLALVVAVTAGAQTGIVQFPYNPDADGNNLIGFSDILEILTLYGSEFSPEYTCYLNGDSSHVLIETGEMNYVSCLGSCANLGHGFSMANLTDIGRHMQDIPTSGSEIWILDSQMESIDFELQYPHVPTLKYFSDYNSWSIDFDQNFSPSGRCFCASSENRKVEYFWICENWNNVCCTEAAEDLLSIQINEYTAQGWWPLGRVDNTGGNICQAMWRWAE